MAANDDQARLDALRTQAGELYLAGHTEKHEQERREGDLWQREHEDRHQRQLTSHEQKHTAEQEAVKAALAGEERRLEGHATSHAAAHAAHEREHELTQQLFDQHNDSHVLKHADEYRALQAAQTSMDKRLDAMNEFRDQLRDQAATFVRREVVDALEAQLAARFDELRALVATEREERRASEGSKRGSSAQWAYIVAAISAVGGLLAIVIVIANLLTSVPTP